MDENGCTSALTRPFMAVACRHPRDTDPAEGFLSGPGVSCHSRRDFSQLGRDLTGLFASVSPGQACACTVRNGLFYHHHAAIKTIASDLPFKSAHHVRPQRPRSGKVIPSNHWTATASRTPRSLWTPSSSVRVRASAPASSIWRAGPSSGTAAVRHPRHRDARFQGRGRAGRPTGQD